MPTERIAEDLKPMIFYNRISAELKNFCGCISNEYYSWNNFVNQLTEESIFALFKKLRKYKGIRVTFKNLAAMKILVAMEDDLLIVDRHVAKVFGLDKSVTNKGRIEERGFKKLLQKAEKITDELKKRGLRVCMATWSLSIWFSKTKILADTLLNL